MAIYILDAGTDQQRGAAIEKRLREAIPGIVRINRIEDVTRTVTSDADQQSHVIIIVPTEDSTYLKQFIEVVSRRSDGPFFIIMSDEISASEYKTILRTERADWVSANAGATEVLDIVMRTSSDRGLQNEDRTKAVVVSLVPCAGGVGNATLAVEIGVHLKTSKVTRNRRVCIVDLDFQESHVCDYLDIEPRLQIQEISTNPERLDAHLFDIFISRHVSGLHVFAAPRSKFDTCDLNVEALDRFFDMVSMRYDLILIDLPPTWFAWTRQIVSASDGVVVLGMNTIPSLRQTVEAIAAVREAARPDAKVIAVVNRCQRHLLGSIVRRRHVETVLGNERVFYVGEEPTALQSVNAGAPMSLTRSYRRIGKDIAALATFCIEVKSSRTAVA